MCGHTFCFLGREPWRGWRWKSSKLLSPEPVPELARLLGTQAAHWEQAESFSLAPGGDVPAPRHRSPPPHSATPVLWGNLLCLERSVSLGRSPPAFPGVMLRRTFSLRLVAAWSRIWGVQPQLRVGQSAWVAASSVERKPNHSHF